MLLGEAVGIDIERREVLLSDGGPVVYDTLIVATGARHSYFGNDQWAKPEPKPKPHPEPEPTPKPHPEPEPEPTPKPHPEPEPTPKPHPEPEPTPRPARARRPRRGVAAVPGPTARADARGPADPPGLWGQTPVAPGGRAPVPTEGRAQTGTSSRLRTRQSSCSAVNGFAMKSATAPPSPW